MDEVVRLVDPSLRERGFRKQRHAFARAVEDGTVQAIAFQMGRFEPAEERRPGYHGAFTVELGVWFAAVAELLDEERPRFVRPFDCHVRQRLGLLLEKPEDTWWTLEQPARLIADAMVEAFDELALPWLDSLSTPRAALAAPNLGPAVVTALHLACGDREAATDHVKHEVRTTQHRAAAERLVGWAQGLGLEVSLEDATIVGMLERERAEWR
jgi:hypothetical protein